MVSRWPLFGALSLAWLAGCGDDSIGNESHAVTDSGPTHDASDGGVSDHASPSDGKTDHQGAGGSAGSAGIGGSAGTGPAPCPEGDHLTCGTLTDQDPKSLYECKGGIWTEKETCAGSCLTQGGGNDDRCSCPAGDGSYCGNAQNPAAQDPNTLYSCGDGLWSSKEACSGNCVVAPQGQSDHCGACPSGNGLYCGSDGVGGDPNTLYKCDNGTLTAVQVCTGECHTAPAGTSDSCACPSGNGDYCGNDGLGLDANTLYSCAGGKVTVKQVCPNGCLVAPPGQSDTCHSGACPSGNGLYCGSDGVGGDADTLYKCDNGNLTQVQHCASGCQAAGAGKDDYCTNSCSGAANSALQWEADQLACCASTWHNWCLKFVYDAYSHAGMNLGLIASPSAKDALHNVESAGKLTYDENPPCGAILFWEATSCNGYWGHVVIANGDGTVSTSGWSGYAGSTHATISWLDSMECTKAKGWFLP